MLAIQDLDGKLNDLQDVIHNAKLVRIGDVYYIGGISIIYIRVTD